MSTGNLVGEKKSVAETFQILGEGDTPKLYGRTVTLDLSNDVPYTGGVSVDGMTVYIDRSAVAELKTNKTGVRGMSPRQVIAVWCEHEHAEKAAEDGDNPADAYLAVHGVATCKEEESVRLMGVNPDRYEEAIKPLLLRTMARDPEDPPKDLWCGPYLDDPTPRDKELLRIFRAKGVLDAFKKSKVAMNYGMRGHECRKCVHFGDGKPVHGDLAQCEVVCGLVRANRGCDAWKGK
jgi:hypothetical protein